MRFAVPTLLALAVVLCGCENEGRSDEARETLVRYLAAIAGGSDEHGWSLLSSDSRESLEAVTRRRLTCHRRSTAGAAAHDQAAPCRHGTTASILG